MATDRSPRFPPAGGLRLATDGRDAAQGDVEGTRAWTEDGERRVDWLVEQHRLIDLEDGFRD